MTSGDFTRRTFLGASAGAACAATQAAATQAAAAQAAPVAASRVVAAIGPGPAALSLSVNGMAHRLSVEPRATLVEVLRDQLGLTGTKLGCDRGACAACTVWLDGAPVCACMMFAHDAAGHRITTIEGLARGDALHPVQAAFIAHDAMQCGFCTPGLVMSCAALLEREPDPDAAQVQAAIAGHLCRCGSYPHVVDATLAAAAARRAAGE